MEKREERRAATYRKCVRRRWVCLFLWRWGRAPWWLKSLPRWMAYPQWFAKTTNGCDCRGRRHGNPKVGGGCCTAGYRPSWRQRQEGRRLCARWLNGLED